ncbi:MAG TPA: class I SAM-dependent methyltransferase [Symbiobacteriaceae bacterium]|nr:class I SAM-dependent methyltransferase [Symbiobacteriaceae bacterium]
MAERCPLCEGEVLTLRYAYPAFRLLECQSCKLLFRERGADLQTAQMIEEIYNDEWVQTHHQAAENKFHQHALYQTTLLTAVKPNRGLLLEIGAGTGEFAYLARQAGWDVVAVEPSANACQYVASQYGLALINGTWSDEMLPADLQFDAICFWHVLEHIAEPVEFLKGMAGRLAPEGLILLAVPNLNAFTNQVMEADSPLLSRQDHLFHYTAETLRMLLAKAGLAAVQLFSREDPTRLQQDIAAWEARTGEKMALPFHQQLGLLVRLQADGHGHELLCVARKA